MAIYAISDLHLSFGTNKPMDIFGENWGNHYKKVKENWNNIVKENDLVLLPGDFSWATYLEDTIEEFKYLDALNGKKILLKGNHDYWWSSLTCMNKFLQDNNLKSISFLHNNSFCFDNYIICGTRGWIYSDNSDDKKILKRENLRLELSLKNGVELFGQDKKIIVNLHFPPVKTLEEDMNLIKTMKKYNVEKCIYGHLHGKSQKDAKLGNIDGIEYKLVSADFLNFSLEKV